MAEFPVKKGNVVLGSYIFCLTLTVRVQQVWVSQSEIQCFLSLMFGGRANLTGKSRNAGVCCHLLAMVGA